MMVAMQKCSKSGRWKRGARLDHHPDFPEDELIFLGAETGDLYLVEKGRTRNIWATKAD
jgi:hypothetical protein